MFYLNPTNYQDHWILAPTKHGVSSRRSMAWLDDIVGDWNDSSGNHYQVGGWLSRENYRTCFFGICFFPVGIYFKKHNTMCVWVFFSVVFFICFFFIILFQLMVRLLSCWFFGAFWVPFLASEDRSPNMKNGIFGIGKKRGNPIWGTPNHRDRPKPTNNYLPPRCLAASLHLKNGGFSRPVGFW